MPGPGVCPRPFAPANAAATGRLNSGQHLRLSAAQSLARHTASGFEEEHESRPVAVDDSGSPAPFQFAQFQIAA